MTIGMMVYVQVLLMAFVVFVRVLLMVFGRIRRMIGWFEGLVIGSIVVGSGVCYVLVGHPPLDGLFVVMGGGLIGFGLCMVSSYLSG